MLNLLTTMAETVPSMSEDVSFLILLVVYGVVFGGLFAVLFVYWLFKAIAIFKMSKKLNLNMPWLSFVPYCLPFAYGRIAEMYNKDHFKKPIKYSILLLILQFVPGILVFILYFFLFAIVFAAAALMSIPGMEVIAVILILLFYFIFLCCYDGYSICCKFVYISCLLERVCNFRRGKERAFIYSFNNNWHRAVCAFCPSQQGTTKFKGRICCS